MMRADDEPLRVDVETRTVRVRAHVRSVDRSTAYEGRVDADDESRWLALCVSFVGALILTLMLITSGCSPLSGAVHAANATLAALDTAAPAVEACGDEWREAATPAALAEVDRVCLPLVRAYRVARLAHAELVAALVLAQARGSGDVTQAAQRALDASTALARALAEVTPR